nr:hypothetical protein [Prevotella pallens]
MANNPLGVGADSSCPYPDITKYTYPHYQIRVSVSPHAHIHSPFRGCTRICGHDKSTPTAADGLPKHCERIVITF